jgi:predicted MPP superfamily phosphohydrolase
MATTIRWLHLTDLHTGMDHQDWLWPRLHDKFRQDLEGIHRAAGPWDLVLFTGDFVQTGSEYRELEKKLDDVWSWFNKLQPNQQPKLLAVPGNHDVRWRDATQAAVEVLENWSQRRDVRERFWNGSGNEYRQVVQAAFGEYDKWWRNTPLKPDGVQHGMLPGDFSCTITKDDLSLGIVGLNSAFLQLTNKTDYERRLALHSKQFHKVCGDDGVDWANSRHACILMTHHPPEWLDEESRRHLNGEILPSFCLHLCGHNHETSVLQELKAGAAHAPVRWLGRSILGLEYLGNGRLDRSHGYVAGVLSADLNKARGQMQFMPRRREKEGDNLDFVPDQAVKLNSKNWTRRFPINLRSVGVFPLPPQAPTALVNAKELFRGVSEKIAAIFEDQPALRDELERALKSDDPKVRATAKDIIDVIFADGLFVVLTRFLGWMRKANPRRYAEQLVDLVNAFSALGVPPERVHDLRQNLEHRRIDISASSTPAVAAMIAGALLDVPVKWTVGPRHDPKYDLYVPLSEDEVPYAGNERDSILFELKKRLIEFSYLDLSISPDHPDATHLLEQRLRGLNALGTPVVTILREDEAVLRLLGDDNSLDWRNLLVMRRKPGVEQVLPDALAVSTVVQGILKKLQPIVDSRPLGRDLP